MKILIIEDEKHNVTHLTRMIEEIDSSHEILGALATVSAAVDYLTSNPSPDLILADIRLKDGLSFEALRQSNTTAPVIFTTAYDDYAIKAFKFNSLDYLLKPIDIDELRSAIKKVEKRTIELTYSSDEIKQLFDALRKNNFKYRERFLIPYRDGFRTVMVKDINHIAMCDQTVSIFLKDGMSIPISFSMGELESQLNPDIFFRANRQYIVHIDNILSISNFFNGRLIMRLKYYNDVKIVISRDKIAELRAWIDR
jgi:two-component system, LytTR family, response regulator LytT